MDYLEKEFVYDFLDNLTEEDKERLMAGNEETMRKIEQLVQSVKVTEDALEIVKNYKWNHM